MHTFKTIDGKEVKIGDIIVYNTRCGLIMAKIVGFSYRVDYSDRIISKMQVRRIYDLGNMRLSYYRTTLTPKAQCVLLK